MRRTIAASILATVCATSLFSQSEGDQVSKVGTTAATFLEIPVGARAIGMGGAFVGSANDVTSLYWNPAGMARLADREALFSHANWIADMMFNFAGVVVPLGSFGAVGVSFTSLTMDDMVVRTVERPDGTGEYFSAADFAVGLHYARNLSDRFSIGFTAKYISQSIWHMQAQAFAMDLGALFTTQFFNGMRIGAAITNFGTDMHMAGRDARTFHPIDDRKLGSNDRIPQAIEMDSWPLPLNFQVGLAVDVLSSEEHTLTVSVDGFYPSGNTESVNVGAEFGFYNTLFLRAGQQSLLLDDREGGLSAGMGVLASLFGDNVKGSVDYAYTDFARLKEVHTISVSIRF